MQVVNEMAEAERKPGFFQTLPGVATVIVGMCVIVGVITYIDASEQNVSRQKDIRICDLKGGDLIGNICFRKGSIIK